MSVKDVLKVNRKTFLNPRSWVGYDALKDQNRTIWRVLKDLFTPATPTRTETFDAAAERFNLSEEELRQAQANFSFFSIFFLVLSVLSLCIGFYLLIWHRTFAGLILSFATAALFGAQAFKYHFWFFQTKNRKLGCTFQEWRQQKINNSQDENNP